jgi:RNA recognition motif-containing protein
MQATLALRFGGEGVLKMKGIPFKATALDVRKFFAGYKIKPEGVSFIMHADGRPTGMAFIEFETPQEAVRAMEKDRAKFGPEYGDRFCMLQLVGRHEMEKVTLQRENENTANKLLVSLWTGEGVHAQISQTIGTIPVGVSTSDQLIQATTLLCRHVHEPHDFWFANFLP